MSRGVLLLVWSLLSISAAADAPRARPVIDSTFGFNTIVTDQHTRLRGVSLSWDGGDPHGSQPKVIPTSALQRLADTFGLNTIHVYLEGNASQNPNPVGVNLADADALVAATREAGLYVILTIGCNGENGSIHSMDFARDFWSLYARGTKMKRTSSLKRTTNQPCTPQASGRCKIGIDRSSCTTTSETERRVTDFAGLIYGFAGDPTFGINLLEANGVTWDNWPAHHGYESKAGIESTIASVQSGPNGPALLNTEFWPGDTEGQGYNSMYESHLNGWMQFQWLGG